MDMEAFEKDLRVEVKKLPPELIPILKELADKFGAQLEGIAMGMMASLGRHVQTAMMEKAMGTLDGDELQATVMRVLKEAM